MKILTLSEIERALAEVDLFGEIESGFVSYSAGEAVVPPVGELLLEKGEVHIKYGYIRGDRYYVVKIASGFYENPEIGLPSSNGMVLLFSQRTGEPVAVLLDEGRLTDIRTAVAGAIAAKYLAPRNVTAIGIVGTGIQARLQLRYLAGVTDCHKAVVWGRNRSHAEDYKAEMEALGFDVRIAGDTSEVLQKCNLVVTCTPSTSPLLYADDLRPGTHITAVGSDTPEKQELDPEILARADLVVADSISQCLERGEIHKAVKAGKISGSELVELGDVIAGSSQGRTSEEQITVADLTGVAVQDIKIAEAVYGA